MRPTLLLALCAIACNPPEAEEIPTAPDMSALVEIYAHPTGDLTRESAQEILANVLGLQTELGQMNILQGAIGQVLQGFGGEDSETEQALRFATAENEQALDSPLGVMRQGLSIDGWARVRWICPDASWDVIDEAAGDIILTTTLSEDTGIGEVIWGEARDCLINDGTTRRRFDGAIEMHQSEDFTRLLVRFEGVMQTDDEPEEALELDLLYDEPVILTRRETEGGTLLVGFSGVEDDPQPIRVVDATGSWACTVDEALSGDCQGTAEQEASW